MHDKLTLLVVYSVHVPWCLHIPQLLTHSVTVACSSLIEKKGRPGETSLAMDLAGRHHSPLLLDAQENGGLAGTMCFLLLFAPSNALA